MCSLHILNIILRLSGSSHARVLSSNRSIPPFSSASSLSEASTGSGSTNSNTSSAQQSEPDNSEVASGPHFNGRPTSSVGMASGGGEAHSDTSSGVCSSYQSSGDASHSTTGPRQPYTSPYQPKPAGAGHPVLHPTQQQQNRNKDGGGDNDDDDDESSSSSESSCSESSDSSGNGVNGRSPAFDVGTLVVCVQKQLAKEEGRLALNPGDIVQGNPYG